MTKTLEELRADYHSLFYVEDKVVFPLLLSMVIGSKLNAPPVWMYIIGPSSGGKSSLLSVINKVPFCTQISDLTPNTFLSGMKTAGKETSLLKKLGNNFVIVMKDFTTMISKDDQAKKTIISQMREIYDGHIVKATGTGDVIEWGSKEKPWKGTFIMAATEGIYKVQSEFADMGTRAINYIFQDQDRKKTTKAALMNKRNNAAFNEHLGVLQEEVAAFVMERIENAPHTFDPIPEELENDLIEVGDLSSMCRSVVDRDYRGQINLALSAEYPMRMSEQLLAMAQFMTYTNGGSLTDEMRKAIFKTAFDSIPKQRRLILELMAKFDKIEINGIAAKIHYPPERVREWVEDLHMFKIVDRTFDGRKEWWVLDEEHRKTIQKFFGVEEEGGSLEVDENGFIGQVPEKDMTWEQRQAALNTQSVFNMI
jgi:hypothetical protein